MKERNPMKNSDHQRGDGSKLWKLAVDTENPWVNDVVDGSGIRLHQLRLVVYPTIYKVLAPSQVVQDF